MLLERLIIRVERWIESIDRERDELALALPGASDLARPAIDMRIAVLEKKRAQAVQRLLELCRQRSWEELMFSRRPRPLKAQLRAATSKGGCLMTPPFLDLFNLPEDDRIALFAQAVRLGKTIGFFVDNDEKADRYLQKLGEKVAHKVIYRGGAPGPSVLVKVGPLGN